MHKLFIACVIVAFCSCNDSGSGKEGGNSDTTAVNENTVQTPPVEAVKADPAAIPATIKFPGNLQEAWQWKDKLGDNLLITSLIPPHEEKNKEGDEGQSATLYAFHYVKTGGDYKLLWKTEDGEKVCPVDITVEFLKNSTTVTDLDKDGIAETKLQYALACRGDVSPAQMKVVLHEDTAPYILNGSRWIKYDDKSKFDINEKNVNMESLPAIHDETERILRGYGRYESEKAFAQAPPEFLAYVRNEWLKYVIEK